MEQLRQDTGSSRLLKERGPLLLILSTPVRVHVHVRVCMRV